MKTNSTKVADYRSIAIVFDPLRSEFNATVGKKMLHAPSLASCKKKIDAIVDAVPFKKFNVLKFNLSTSRYLNDGKLESVEIVGIEKSDGSRYSTASRGKLQYRKAAGGVSTNEILDTQDNREYVKRAMTLTKQKSMAIAQLQKEIDAIKVSLPYTHVDDYKP